MRARTHIVKDVDRAVERLGDVKEIVERRAREVLQRGGAALVGLALRRVLDLHAVLEDLVAIDLQATLGLDRELEVNLGSRPTHSAHNLDVVRNVVLGGRVLPKAGLKRVSSKPVWGL